MSTGETAISRWLQTEMTRRGYPLHGHRAGGISRLAKDAGIPQASMSRLVNGGGEASLENLRRIGQVFGYSLGEMVVFAGIAEPDEMVTTHYGSAHLSATSGMSATAEGIPAPPGDLPKDVDWPKLSDLQRHLWLAPAPLDMRESWLHMLEVVERHSAPGGVGAAVHPIEGRSRKYV